MRLSLNLSSLLKIQSTQLIHTLHTSLGLQYIILLKIHILYLTSFKWERKYLLSCMHSLRKTHFSFYAVPSLRVSKKSTYNNPVPCISRWRKEKSLRPLCQTYTWRDREITIKSGKRIYSQRFEFGWCTTELTLVSPISKIWKDSILFVRILGIRELVLVA